MVSFFIPDLIYRAHGSFAKAERAGVYIFDASESSESPDFLGGAALGENVEVTPEIELADLRAFNYEFMTESNLEIASRQWTFIVVATDDSFESSPVFVVLGATMIFLASACLALWMFTHHRRTAKINELMAKSESEKTALVVANARNLAQAEREMNDYIAHVSILLCPSLIYLCILSFSPSWPQ